MNAYRRSSSGRGKDEEAGAVRAPLHHGAQYPVHPANLSGKLIRAVLQALHALIQKHPALACNGQMIDSHSSRSRSFRPDICLYLRDLYDLQLVMLPGGGGVYCARFRSKYFPGWTCRQLRMYADPPQYLITAF